MQTLKDFITGADNNILRMKYTKLTSLEQNRHAAAHSDKVQAALEMCENAGSANSVAVTDASVRVDCVCEVA